MSAAAPFARLEARVNAAVNRHLANAVAQYTPTAGGQARDLGVIFDAQYQTDLDGMVGGNAPVIQCLEEAVADMQEDARFVVRGVTYAVVEPQPDGTGWLLLRLRVVTA